MDFVLIENVNFWCKINYICFFKKENPLRKTEPLKYLWYVLQYELDFSAYITNIESYKKM